MPLYVSFVLSNYVPVDGDADTILGSSRFSRRQLLIVRLAPVFFGLITVGLTAALAISILVVGFVVLEIAIEESRGLEPDYWKLAHRSNPESRGSPTYNAIEIELAVFPNDYEVVSRHRSLRIRKAV